jgi:hypothetical protein
MKKLFLGIVVLVAIVVIAIVNTRGNKHRKMLATDLALANVEALANSENGIPASWCFKYVTPGTYAVKLFCDSRTGSNMIYPCPQESFGYFVSGVTDRCTTQN